MSVAPHESLYQEQTARISAHEQIDAALAELKEGQKRFAATSIADRIRLAEGCLEGLFRTAREWVDVACQAKGIAADSPTRAEEVTGGPLATARYLRLLIRTLQDIERTGRVQLPGAVADAPGGRIRIPVVPAKGLFDSVAFAGFKSYVWMLPEVSRENLPEHLARHYAGGKPAATSSIALVLGAGNVSSIPPTDVFSKMFHEGQVVLLKMNPVNEYLGPIFERAFATLIDAGYLRIVYGGADIGGYCVEHELVDEVHITGSVYAHDSIVWGPPGPERDRRQAENDPLLNKRITSELGNVTPWIVVPGPYTEKQLRFQAENLASTITNNASFNCVATKVIVTHSGWKDRERFLTLLEEVLSEVPPRQAYYPGACGRFERFTGEQPTGVAEGTLPWKLVRNADPGQDPQFFNDESFVCVFAETALDADSEDQFLDVAAEFCNEQLWGTLGAGVMVHPSSRRKPGGEERFQNFIADLRYGTIGVNLWPAISYALISPPWGGYPGATLKDVQSGVGWVHNTYLLEDAEKSVVEGPLTAFPKPLWFSSHRAPEAVAWRVVDLYKNPNVFRLPGLLVAALKG